MKRLIRKPEKYDLIELFAAVARQEGYRIDVPADAHAFSERMAASLEAVLGNPNLLHGKRVEAMFAHVLGALGQCRMIKQEDGGAAFGNATDMAIPDYRVVMNDGRLMLIEVKNFHMRDFRHRFELKRSYLASLTAYAEMNRAELRIAIYFSRVNKWVLLPPGAFFVEERKVWTDFAHAMARSEMSSLGDRTIATLPPLALEFTGDAQDGGALIGIDGDVQTIIRSVKFTCAGNEIVDEEERRIAFYLMRYGSWKVTQPANVVEGRLVSWSIQCEPQEPDDISDEQPFCMVGDLSAMVSTASRELTVDEEAGIVAIDVKHDPTAFNVRIPIDHRGDALPLWQFVMQPNPDFATRLE